MQKELYTGAETEIIEFDSDDIIATSNGDWQTPGTNEDDFWKD